MSLFGSFDVVVPDPQFTESDVESMVEKVRLAYGETVSAERPAEFGDRVVIDIDASYVVSHLPHAGLSVDEMTLSLGEGVIAQGVDEQIVGLRAGEGTSFCLLVDGQAVLLKVSVRAVQTRVPVAFDDELAQRVLPGSVMIRTSESLRESLTGQLAEQRRDAAQVAKRRGLEDHLAGSVPDRPSKTMITAAIDQRLANINERRRESHAPEVDLDELRRSTPDLEDEVVRQWRLARAVEKLIEVEEVFLSEEEVELEMAAIRDQVRVELPNEESRRQFDRHEERRLPPRARVRHSLLINKALERFGGHCRLVTEDGREVDPSELDGINQEMS